MRARKFSPTWFPRRNIWCTDSDVLSPRPPTTHTTTNVVSSATQCLPVFVLRPQRRSSYNWEPCRGSTPDPLPNKRLLLAITNATRRTTERRAPNWERESMEMAIRMVWDWI
jgi:hypothetical protein